MWKEAEQLRCVNKKRGQRGSTLLEFGLVIIVMLMFLFGIIDFGRALYTYHFVSNAAREATRYASVRGSACKLPSPCPAQPSDISNYVVSITPSGINPANVSVDTNSGDIWPGTGPGSSSGNNGGCDTTNGPNSPGCLVYVQVSYPFNFILPFMPTTTCGVGQNTGNICISNSSEMVISQ
jgi:hypothetical protein